MNLDKWLICWKQTPRINLFCQLKLIIGTKLINNWMGKLILNTLLIYQHKNSGLDSILNTTEKLQKVTTTKLLVNPNQLNKVHISLLSLPKPPIHNLKTPLVPNPNNLLLTTKNTLGTLTIFVNNHQA